MTDWKTITYIGLVALVCEIVFFLAACLVFVLLGN
jgi:hypothetical protein